MKALLVIDMQNVYIGKDHTIFFNYNRQQIISAVNKVIDDNSENIIIYIQNFMKKNFINKFLPFKAYKGTKEAELISELHIVSDLIFDKYVGDAFSNNKLNEFLKSKNIDTIEVIGIDGGGCVALTALGAIKNGYNVIVNTNAIGTSKILDKNKEKYFKKLRQQGAEFI